MAKTQVKGPTKFLVLFVTTAVQTLVTMNVVIPAAIAPEMAVMLGVSPSLIGFQIGITYFGAAMLSSMSGVLVRRWGALRTSQFALIFAGVGAGFMAVPSLPVLAIGAIFCGLGYALTNPPASHLLAQVTSKKDRNFLFSIKQTSVPLGGIAAGFMAPPLALNWGVQVPLVIGVFVALSAALIMQSLRKTWDADRTPRYSLRRSPLGQMSFIWRDRRLRYFGLVAFCFAATQLCLTTFAVTMLVNDLNFNLIEAGVVLAVLQVAGVAGRLWWGWIADYILDGNSVLLIIALLSVIFAIVTAQVSSNMPHVWIYALMSAFSFAAVGWNGVFMAEIARLAPEATSQATGAVLVISFTGILIGPPAFTIIHGLVGSYLHTFGVFSVVSLIGGIFLWQIRRCRG